MLHSARHLLLGLAIGIPTLSTAADGPHLGFVVTVKSIDSLLSTGDHYAKLAGPNVSVPPLKTLLDQYAGGLPGVDRRRPFGFAFYTHTGEDTTPLLFVPISDRQAFTQFLSSGQSMLSGLATSQPLTIENGWLLAGPGLRFFTPQTLPSPSRLIDQNARSYDIAFSARYGELPPEVIEAGLEYGLRLNRSRSRGSSAERFGAQVAEIFTRNFLAKYMHQVEEAGLGVQLRPGSGIVADSWFTVKPGTELAAVVSSASRTPARFGALFDRAATASLTSNFELSPSIRSQLISMLPQPRTQKGALASAKPSLADEQLSILRRTIEAGKVDFAYSLRGMSPAPACHVFAVGVADAERFGELLIREIKTKERGKVAVKKNMTKINGLTAHYVKVLKPSKQQRALHGNQLEAYIASDESTLYCAFGSRALENLKWLVGRSLDKRSVNDSYTPLRLQIQLRALAERFKSVDREAAKLAKYLPAGESILVEVTPVSRGFRTRLQVREGLIQAIAAAATK